MRKKNRSPKISGTVNPRLRNLSTRCVEVLFIHNHAFVRPGTCFNLATANSPHLSGAVEAPPDSERAELKTKDIVYFKLRDTHVPVPLGWTLSAAAARTIREQINKDDDVVQNQSALNEVLKTLPPPPVIIFQSVLERSFSQTREDSKGERLFSMLELEFVGGFMLFGPMQSRRQAAVEPCPHPSFCSMQYGTSMLHKVWTF